MYILCLYFDVLRIRIKCARGRRIRRVAAGLPARVGLDQVLRQPPPGPAGAPPADARRKLAMALP